MSMIAKILAETKVMLTVTVKTEMMTMIKTRAHRTTLILLEFFKLLETVVKLSLTISTLTQRKTSILVRFCAAFEEERTDSLPDDFEPNAKGDFDFSAGLSAVFDECNKDDKGGID